MKKLPIIILLCVANVLKSQDIHFSQIQESPLWLNPANAGFFNGYVRSIANYRNQWASMGNAFQTMAVSIDAVAFKTRKNKAYLGAGLFAFNDEAGVAKMGSTQAQLHLSAIIKTSKKSKLAAAGYFGYAQTKANYNSLTFGNQYNGNEITQSLASGESFKNVSFFNADVGIGLNYEYSSANAEMLRDDIFSLKIGGAIHHLNKPTQSFGSGSNYTLPMRIVGNVQVRYDIEDSKFSVLPSLIYIKQASATEINLGALMRYRFKNATKITGISSESGLNFGLFFRVGDAIVPQVNLDMGKYAIGISYDYNVSRYYKVSKGNGGFEIFLKFISLDDALFKRKREHGLK